MMASRYVVFLCFVWISNMSQYSCRSTFQEPMCTKFDFEEKVLEKMIRVEHEMSLLKENNRQKLEDIKADKLTLLNEVKILSSGLKEEQTSTLSQLNKVGEDLENNIKEQLVELNALGEGLKENVSEKIGELDSLKNALTEDFATMYKNFETEADAKWKDIRDEVIKPPVLFHARTVSTTSPGTNTLLRFTETLVNTDNVYDTSTGYFTAPTNGTYWFDVKICVHPSKYVNIQVYANDLLITDTMLYETTGYAPCFSISAAAILKIGDKVCVKTGPGTYAGTAIYQSTNYHWNTFMSALVH